MEKNATATILYRKSDLSHANAWVLNNVSNRGDVRIYFQILLTLGNI